MKFHPVADIFPLMNDDELERLTEDIRQNGQREPVVVFDNQIVDGRNRFLACEKLEIEPLTREWSGTSETLIHIVVSLNLHRRHLNESQRALIAARLTNSERGRPEKNASIEAFISQPNAASMLNVSRSNVQRAAAVLNNGVFELAEQVESGELSVSAAADIAELPRTKQMRIIKRGRDAKKKLASKLREKKVVETNRQTGVVCLLCHAEAVEVTDETLAVHLTKLIERAPKYKRFFDDVLEELEAEGVSDAYLGAKELILEATDLGFCELRQIQAKTGLDAETVKHCLSVMMEYGVLKAVEQEGKSEVARGQKKTLYKRTSAKTGELLNKINNLPDFNPGPVFSDGPVSEAVM